MKHKFKDKNYYYLSLILLAALIVRIFILHFRWINPDEGAHLMDARFILDGYLPLVDYDSRQPFYLVIISVFFKLFGVSYKVGRLLPLFSSLGAGVMLFLIGRRLFNSKVGLIACTIFLFLPLSLIWSTVVKTEPLAIFLACTSIFFVIKSTDDSIYRFGWMILAGIFAALAFYARQLSIYLPLTITIYLLFRRDIKLKQIISQLLLYFLGYLSICVAISSFFLSKLGYQQIIFSQLNPFYIVFFNVFHLLDLLPQDLQVVNSSGIRVLDQDLSKTMTQWQDAFFFSFFIVLGALAVGIRTFFGSYRDNAIKENLVKYKYNYLLLSLWLVFVLLPYIMQSVVRGFYTQYFVELLPPFILLASLYFDVIYKKLNIRFLSFITYSIGWLYIFFILQKLFWNYYPGIGFYMLIGTIFASLSLYFFSSKWKLKILLLLNFASITVVGLLYFSFVELKLGEVLSTLITMLVLYFVIKYLGIRLTRTQDVRMDAFARIFIVVVAFTITGAFSGRYIGPKYDSIWSPKTVGQVNRILREKSEPGNQVLSGATIWTLENNLVPFLNISHPTEFVKRAWPDFENKFRGKMPKFIIVDGYTEKKFQRFWEFIEKEIEQNYSRITRISNSRYPVIIYMLNEDSTDIKTYLAQN